MNNSHYDINPMPSTRETHLPAEDVSSTITFQCSQCGECCSSILIHIEVEKLTVLKEKSWFQERLKAFKTEVKAWNAQYGLLPHKPDKTCVFLNENKHCLIEANEGKALKPAECKNFPFATLKLPDGRHLYDCSAACKHVAEDLLSTYKSILPEPSWAKTLPAQKAPEKVRIGLFRSISWHDYLDKQERLKRVFLNAKTAEEAWNSSKRVLFGDTPHPNPPPQGERGLSPLKILVPQKKYLFHCFILLFFLRKPYGTYSLIQLLRPRSYRDDFIFGSGELPGISLTQRPHRFTREAEDYLKAFTYNILNRYVLFSHGHWVSDLLAIAKVAIVLARWYALVIAEANQGTESVIEVDQEEMIQAIRLVERYYTGHQPRFLAFFNKSFLGIHTGTLLSRLF